MTIRRIIKLQQIAIIKELVDFDFLERVKLWMNKTD